MPQKMDFSINPVVAYANRYQFGAGEVVNNPRVESRMLLWCKAGKGRVTANGERFPFKPSDYLVLPWLHAIKYEADEKFPFLLAGVHVIPNHARNKPVEFSVSHTRSNPLANCAWRRDALLPGLDRVRSGSFAAHPALRLLAEYVVERFPASRQADEKEMRTLSELVLAEISRTLTASPTGQQPAALDRMTQWVMNHLTEPANLPTLAALAGCSVATVRRLFDRHLKTSPLTWIARTKSARAEELLRTTSLSVADIGRAVGVEDAFYFSRWFRKQTGQSPRQARSGRAL